MIASMVKVFILYTDGISPDEAKALPYLTDKDVRDAERYRLCEDKTVHLLSSYLKRKYVGDWTVDEHGKPVSDGIFFNVSHCKKAVAIAISDGPVGIDVENVRPFKEKVGEYIASDEEKALLDTDIDFYKIWTAKESLAKADGKGIDKRPSAIPAIPYDGVKTYDGKQYFSRQTIADDMVLTVTKAGEEAFDWVIITENLPGFEA